MKGFIVYSTYRTEEDYSEIHLFGRLENNESFLVKIPYKQYFFIKEIDYEKSKEHCGQIEPTYEKTTLKNFNDEKVIKVILPSPQKSIELRKQFEENKIACYEADIKFAQRFLIDHGIRGSLEIDGAFERGERINRIYDDPKISSCEFIPKLKVLSFDIETSKDAKELYSISIVCEVYKKTFIVSKKAIDDCDFCEVCPDEKSVLIKFQEKIIELDPDIITGWNVIDFDLFILQKKFKKYKIDFDFGRINWPSKLKIEERFLVDSKADFPGRAVLDGIWLLKASMISLPDYKLDTAAQKFLGEKKLIGAENKGAEIEKLFLEDKKKLAEYNLKDSELVLGILDKTGVIKLTVMRSILTGMQPDRVRATIASFDSLYLFYVRQKGYVANSSNYGDREGRAKGGFVMSSKPGIYDNIVVLDFKSLYPSVMRTYNIDPLSFAKGTKEKNPIVAQNGAKFGREEGILPNILKNIWIQRDETRKRKDEVARYALKVLMNSFYGALANPTCRFYSLDMANAITHTCQYTIKTTMSEIEKMGYEVIYGDTDSIFVNLKMDVESAQKTAQEIREKINKFWSEKIKNEFDRTSYLELEVDKFFTRFFMPKVRHEDVGSKKRYAGLKLKEGKVELSFTGLETVRRDWTNLAKQFQKELFMRVFKKEDVKEYIKTFVADLKAGKHDDLLVYRKSLSKNPDEYIKTTPPHVKAARQLDEITSNIIEYCMTLDGPQPLEKLRSKIDYAHYIEKQIKPIADTILQFIDEDFENIVTKKGQKSLGDF